MSIRALRLFVSCALLVPVGVSAQILTPPAFAAANGVVLPGPQTASGGAALGIAELERAALERNTDLIAARQEIAAASGLLTQSRLRPNPGLDVTYGTGRPLGSPGERQVEIGYAHTFELGRKRARRIDVGRVGVQIAQLQVADRERQLIAEVKSQYADALAAGRNLQILNELALSSERAVQIAQQRVSEGEAAPLEQALLQIEASRLTAERLMAASQGTRAVAQLKLVAALDTRAPLDLQGDLAVAAVSLSMEEAVQLALAQRPDAKVARQEEQRAAAETALARSERVPDVIGLVRYSRTDLRFEQFGTNSAGQQVALRNVDRSLTLGVSIPLPFANRNQGNIQAADARQQGALLHRQFVEASITAEVTAAYTRYVAAREALAAFETGVINQAQGAMTTIRASYDLGELPLLDVVQEQRRFVETQKAYTDILREHFVARAALEEAVAQELR